MARTNLIIAGLAILTLAVIVWWGWVPDSVSDARCRLSNNAAWIDVDWTSKAPEESATRDLAQRVTDRQIRYLFPYTTYVKPDGSFGQSFGYASQFVSQFRTFNHDTLLLAWIGIPLQNNQVMGIKGWVDLGDPSSRQKLTTFAAALIRDAGFDGVHLDAETVRNNDTAFLTLLDEMRTAIGKSRISIAGSHWIPDAVNLLPFIHDFRWTGSYYFQVARRVGQIATMSYDTYIPVGALYRLWLREQVRGIGNSVAASDTEMLIGISVSHEETLSHHPDVENLRNGLAGLCAALLDNSRGIQGVATYADWEFSPGDRQTWTEWQK